MLIPHDHRNVRAVEATDLDIYKNSLYETLKATYDKLQTHKQEVALKYKEYYDKTHKPADYKIGERVLVHFPDAEKEDLKYKLGKRWRGALL
jgi:hypothetical protein